MITALDLANAFVQEFGQDGCITNLKLNKLVYFAYARYLRSGDKLFSEDIEAWSYGPVIPSVYRAFKHNGNSIIKRPVSQKVPHEALVAARSIWADFGKLGAWDLMNESHREGSAWANTYNDYERHLIISDKAILDSHDGDAPAFSGTFAESEQRAFADFDGALRMLADS